MSEACMLIYYQGKQYLLVLPYLPPSPGEINENYRVDAANPPFLLEPVDIPIDDLKLICFQHNIPLEWILQEKTFCEDEILSFHFIEAAEIFIDSRYSFNTTQNYRVALNNLLNSQVFEKKYPMRKVLHLDVDDVREHIWSKMAHTPATANICISFFMALIKYWNEQLSPTEESRQTLNFPRRRRYPKNIGLKFAEYAQFLRALKTVHSKHSLIAEILWIVNRDLNHPKVPIEQRTIVTLESVLHMRRYDVLINGMIELFRREQPKKLLYIPIKIPKKLHTRLSKLTPHLEAFLFSQKNGSPYRRQQINSSFKKASVQAGFSKIISPSMLRPALLAL